MPDIVVREVETYRMKQIYPLLISTGFLKYPLELKKNFSEH